MEMLGVELDTLQTYGAVSEATVKEMVAGALQNANATTAVSVSGIAGPGGGTKEKPVGTICFAWADASGWLQIETQRFAGDRTSVREQVVRHVLKVLLEHYASK